MYWCIITLLQLIWFRDTMKIPLLMEPVMFGCTYKCVCQEGDVQRGKVLCETEMNTEVGGGDERRAGGVACWRVWLCKGICKAMSTCWHKLGKKTCHSYTAIDVFGWHPNYDWKISWCNWDRMQADDTSIQVSALSIFLRLRPSKMVNIPSVNCYVLLIYCFTN